MSSENPYQAPTTELERKPEINPDEWSFVEPNSVPAGRGLSWIAEGFRFFKMSPLIWIVVTIIYLLILIFSSFIPFATNILQPMMLGGLMIGTHEQDHDNPLEVRHLFEGFNTAGGKLAVLGALVLGITILATLVFLILFFIGAIGGVAAHDAGVGDESIAIIAIFFAIPAALALLFIVSAVSWFGPPLIALHDLPVGEAFKMSLLALKRNLLPLIVFGLVMMFLFLATVFTLYLGLLVVMPIFISAGYAAWKDIFTSASKY